MIVAWAVGALVAMVAAERWARARRTRRQTVEALAAVPVVAGLGTPDPSPLAIALATRLGLGRADVADVATAARLSPLAALVPAGDDPAAAVGLLATESGLSPSVTTVLYEALTANSGGIGRGAAAIRVAATYERRRSEAHVSTAGALFATVRAHPAGHERQAAAALVHLVQGRPTPA